MALTDEEFTEQVSELIGDIAVAVAKLIQPTLTDLSVRGDLHGVQHTIKRQWKDLARRSIELANDN